MEILQAILLGIIEGLTEFLPISSTGHLIVTEDLIGYKDTAEIFTVVIQSGAILAVIWLYRVDLLKKVRGLISREKNTMNFWKNWILATIPAGLAGFILKDQLKTIAVASTVALSLIVGGFLILLVENMLKDKIKKSSQPKLDDLSTKQALQVGFYQVLALVPGVSRSGATIMGGMLSGLDRLTATTFSFYLSMPILVMASIYQLSTGANELGSVTGGATAIIIGTIVSFITALLAIKWLLRYVSSNDFKPFAYYRIVLGLLIILVLV